MPRKLYKLTDGDRAIFRLAQERQDPSIITNYYMRGPDTGTFWFPVNNWEVDKLQLPQSIEAARKWKEGYDKLYYIWNFLKRPDYFGPDHDKNPENWISYTQEQYEKLYDNLQRVYRTQRSFSTPYPTFQHPHGKIFLPWTRDLFNAKQPIRDIIGGYGSAKTYGVAMGFAVNGITLKGYRSFAIAPVSKQANEIHRILLEMILGTRFERFLVAAPMRPQPTIILGNDEIGETLIECFPGDDPGKFLTLTADEALIDQAEYMDGNGKKPDIDTIIREIGSRFRGVIRGRMRVGHITFVANSGDNPQLWDLYDDAQKDPDYIYSKSPTTWDNIYLTIPDLVRYEKQAGKDEYSKKMYLMGYRPKGSGEHFSEETMVKCHNLTLDFRMDEAIKRGEKGYVKLERERVATHTWEMPPEKGRKYIVCADAGWASPPERNSAVIGVWDITEFPKIPAFMRAFCWVDGNNSPNPFIEKFIEYSVTYQAIGNNGYDSTGPSGAGYEKNQSFQDVLAEGYNLAGGKKWSYINLLKKLMADGLLQVPNIPHLFSQCTKYRIPDDRLHQDIVMMLVITAAMLEPFLYVETESADNRDMNFVDDRYDRPTELEEENDRYSRREER